MHRIYYQSGAYNSYLYTFKVRLNIVCVCVCVCVCACVCACVCVCVCVRVRAFTFMVQSHKSSSSFRNIRSKLPSKILICLCFSLLALLVLFLGGVERSGTLLSCQIISGLLQYFLLSKFLWTTISAYNMYVLLVPMKQRSSGEDKLFMLKASAMACGMYP